MMTKMAKMTRVSALALVAGLAFAGSPALATTLKIATDSGAKGSEAGNAIDAWAAKIEAATGGEVKLQVFYQSELGGQQEVFDLLMAGDVDLMLNWPMTSYDQRISLLYTPYMFTTWEEALAAYGDEGWLSAAMDGIYADQGLKFLGAWPEGFNGIGTKGGHATSIEAASRFKVRVPPVSPFTEAVAALGYQTASIDWGELYSAIQTGVVDGDAANVIFYDHTYFGDILTDWTHTRHQFITGVLTANLESLDKLTPEQQQIVEDAAREVMQDRFDAAKTADDANIEAWKALGRTYVALSDDEIAAMSAAVREQVWPVMQGLLGEELMALLRANTEVN